MSACMLNAQSSRNAGVLMACLSRPLPAISDAFVCYGDDIALLDLTTFWSAAEI
jgi:hypothetical protein